MNLTYYNSGYMLYLHSKPRPH